MLVGLLIGPLQNFTGKVCGVWMAQSLLRSSVWRTICLSSTSFTVSLSGTPTATHSPFFAQIDALLDHFLGNKGPHPVMHQNDRGVLLQFLKPVHHRILPFLAADDERPDLGDMILFDNVPEAAFHVFPGKDRE